MEDKEIIVQIGGEGGDLILYGIRTPTGWRYSREVVDQSSLMLDGTTIQHGSDVVDEWEGALVLLDRYRWYFLFPLRVHPEFKERVLKAVKARYQASDLPGHHRLDRWCELCSS